MSKKSVLLLLIPFILFAAPQKQKIKAKQKASPPKMFLAIPGVSQNIQNRQADKDGLSRLRDSETCRAKLVDPCYDIAGFYGSGLLVSLPDVDGLEVKDLDSEWQFVRPWTANFLRDLVAYRKKSRLHGDFFITSAVRTIERQLELQGENQNATKAFGPRASSHLTGATVDITKRGMSQAEIYWMRQTLRPLHGKTIYVVEETLQPCFHIMVYRAYKKPKPW